MRYLCNIGDSLLTSGICAWRVALPWCVGGICFGNAPSPSEVAQGGAGPEAGGRNGYGRQNFSFIRRKSLSPTTVFSTSRNRFFGQP